MALRDTSWIADSTAIIESVEQDEGARYVFLDGTVYVRNVNRTRKVWVCLTYAAAKAYADTHAADTNTSYSVQEDNRIIGSYKLIANIDSVGGWAEA
jgi:hypothetical protein